MKPLVLLLLTISACATAGTQLVLKSNSTVLVVSQEGQVKAAGDVQGLGGQLSLLKLSQLLEGALQRLNETQTELEKLKVSMIHRFFLNTQTYLANTTLVVNDSRVTLVTFELYGGGAAGLYPGGGGGAYCRASLATSFNQTFTIAVGQSGASGTASSVTSGNWSVAAGGGKGPVGYVAGLGGLPSPNCEVGLPGQDGIAYILASGVGEVGGHGGRGAGPLGGSGGQGASYWISATLGSSAGLLFGGGGGGETSQSPASAGANGGVVVSFYA